MANDEIAEEAAAHLRAMDLSWGKIRNDSYDLLVCVSKLPDEIEKIRVSKISLDEFLIRKADVKATIVELKLASEQLASKLTTKEIEYAKGLGTNLSLDALAAKIEKIRGKLGQTTDMYQTEKKKYTDLKNEYRVAKHCHKDLEGALSTKKALIEILKMKLCIRMGKFMDKNNWAVLLEQSDSGALRDFVQFIKEKKFEGATYLLFTVGKSIKSMAHSHLITAVQELTNGAFQLVTSKHLYRISTTGNGIAEFHILDEEEMDELDFKH